MSSADSSPNGVSRMPKGQRLRRAILPRLLTGHGLRTKDPHRYGELASAQASRLLAETEEKLVEAEVETGAIEEQREGPLLAVGLNVLEHAELRVVEVGMPRQPVTEAS